MAYKLFFKEDSITVEQNWGNRGNSIRPLVQRGK